ncbi:MAG: SMC family ATPase [SAR202 cluster bacterium]|nr:SMC family ATPase [SAR202 cluster bacterium]
MIPISLQVKNFLSYRDNVPRLNLDGIHVACLSGDNGHGKSAILDAITWALWGSARSRSQEELIFQGETEMGVDLEFRVDSERFRVSRRYAKAKGGRQGSTMLDLFQLMSDGTYLPIVGNSIRETEAKIRNLLHMDYETFTSSAFLLQGKSDLFTTSTPAKRKELLAEVLGLEWYDKLSEKARLLTRQKDSEASSTRFEIENIDSDLSNQQDFESRLQAAKSEMGILDGKISDLENKIEVYFTELQKQNRIRIELDRLENEQKRILDEINSREANVESQSKTVDDLKQKSNAIGVLETQLKLAESDLEKITLLPDEISQEKENINRLLGDIVSIKEVNINLKNGMEDLRIKVDLLWEQTKSDDGNPDCPLCGEELGAEGCRRLAESYELEGKQKASQHRENDRIAKQTEKQIAIMQQKLSNKEENYFSDRKTAETNRDNLFKELESARVSKEMVKQVQLSLENERTMMGYSVDRLKEIQTDLNELGFDLNTSNEMNKFYEQAKIELGTLRIQREQTLHNIGSIQGNLDRLKDLMQIRTDKMKDLQETSNEKGLYEQLSVAFGKGGIQALIIEQAIPELENEADEILGRITDYRMSLKLETQRESRSGGDPRETLDIKISDELGTRSYETYSGGEAFRINFALRISLSKLLAHRSGAPLPTLFIDEGFGTQDADGLDKLIDAIKAIQDDFQKIIVITHIDNLKEAFESRIEVVKTSDGSTFSVNY